MAGQRPERLQGKKGQKENSGDIMDKEWESGEVNPDQEFLGWRTISEENGERKVEPFLKVRTLHAWRDIGLSFTEWVFNERGWLTIIEGFLLILVAGAIIDKAGALVAYGIGGMTIGIYIAAFLGWLFSQRDWSGIVVSQIEGQRTYIDTSFSEETGMPKLEYVESKINEFDVRKAPSHIINNGRGKPSLKGINMLGVTKASFDGHEYYFASWQDSTHHIYLGNSSTMSVVAFLASITTLDKRVLKINRHYEKIIKKAQAAYENSKQQYPEMTEEEFQKAVRDGTIQGKNLPKYMDLLEYDKLLMRDINNISEDIDKIESVISKNPLKIDTANLSKYTQRFVVAVTTGNLEREMREEKENHIPLETLKDAYNASQETIKYYSTIPGVWERMKRSVYSNLYSMLEDISGVGAEKIREGEKLLKKHRDDTLRGVSLQKDDSMLEVKK